MSLLIVFFLPVIGSAFILFAQFYGMELLGTDRAVGRRKRWLIASAYVVLLIGISLTNPVASTVANLVSIVGTAVLGNRVFHSGRKYFMYYLLISVSIYLTDALVMTGMQALTLYGILYFNSLELLVIMIMGTTRLAEFMVIRLLVCLVRKNNGQDIKRHQFAASLVLPAFSILNLFTMLYMLQIYLSDGMIAAFLINLVCLLGINLFFGALMDTMGEKGRLEREVALYRQQARMQLKYYEQEEKKYEESRKLIHDIRNHVTTMEELYRSRDAGDAADYAGEIHSMLNRLGQTYYTSNKILNIILNDKVRLMKRMGIHEDIRIGEMDLSFMQETDVTTIFANLLDNAVTAAKDCENPWIRLRVEASRQFISIHMENSSREAPQPDFQSAKAGRHGMGLKNVRRAAEAYDGDAQFEWKEGVFYARILLVGQPAQTGSPCSGSPGSVVGPPGNGSSGSVVGPPGSGSSGSVVGPPGSGSSGSVVGPPGSGSPGSVVGPPGSGSSGSGCSPPGRGSSGSGSGPPGGGRTEPQE